MKKSKRRRKIKQRAQTPMVLKVEEKEDVRIFSHFYRFYFRFVFDFR